MASGRHRAARVLNARRRIAPSIIIAVITVLVLGGAAATYTVVARSGCKGHPVSLTVLAAPEEATLLSNLATSWQDSQPRVRGRCVAVEVVSKDSHEVAAALGANWDDKRDGPHPDVWVPDSTSWVRLAQVRPDAAAVLPEHGPSLASTPIVLAMPRPMAEAVGWPAKQLGWRDLVTKFSAGSSWAPTHPAWGEIKVAMTDPSQDTAGLNALLALLDHNGDQTLSSGELADGSSFEHAVSGFYSTVRDVLTGLRQADRQDKALTYVSVFPATERDISQYNDNSPNIPLAAMYPADGAPDADYPYLVLKAPWVDANRKAVADKLLRFLGGGEARHAFAAAGFRTPDRRAAPMLTEQSGFLRTLPSPDRSAQRPDTVIQAVGTWTALRRRGNTLVVVDTSGSMATAVAGTGRSRLQFVQQATTGVLSLFNDVSDAGLWSYSTDHHELVPLGPVGGKVGDVVRRKALADAIAGLRPGGGTALYETALAAYRQLEASWRPGVANVVVLLTDGVHGDARGITESALLKKLGAERNSAKPLRFLTVGYGPDADIAALQAISRTVGGRSYLARDPKDLPQVLLSALISG